MADPPQPSPPAPAAPPGRGTPSQPWAVAFVLFAIGIALLVAASKMSLHGAADYAVKGLGGVLCVAGFLFSRRKRPPQK